MLRVWLVLSLMAPALGWAQPAPGEQPQVAEQGEHAERSGYTSPAKAPHDRPLRGQPDDCERDIEDDLGKRPAAAPLWLQPVLDFHVAASEVAHGVTDGRDDGPGCLHRDQLHNRGPPVA